jgi:endo-1,4-beta-mannosidase
MTEPPAERFRVGINYWPARTAMGWWSSFDAEEVEADFARLAASGFDSVRLFLTWEHFQPRPDQISSRRVRQLLTTLELAAGAGLCVMPTLFTGHMSGANFIPAWALGGAAADRRFRVVAAGREVEGGIANWYVDPRVAGAQARLARELAAAVAGHPALWAWDLGNEGSNCVVPPSRAHARAWLRRLCDAIHEGDAAALITIGLHMEDLEQDRNLGPAEAAQVCDFLTMHGYPGYAAWSRGPTDEALLPFLAEVTRWLGGGAPVLFSEFGLPTYRDGYPTQDREASATPLVEEQAAADYVERALTALLDCGCTGAMLWCHADYVPAAWRSPPLDSAIHERSFGQWRADGSRKPALAVVEAFAERGVAVRAASSEAPWIDIEPRDFYASPESGLPRLYQRYLASRQPTTR